jgi:hypothetical protein
MLLRLGSAGSCNGPDGTRASRAPSARRRFASTEVVRAAVYHRMGHCHTTSFPWREVGWDFAGVRERPRDGHFMAGGQERERGDGSADVEKSRRTQELILNFLCRRQKLYYRAGVRGRAGPGRRMAKSEGKIFIWIHCNPSKSPVSAKGIQGNAKAFYLDLFGFAWRDREALTRP